MHYDLGSPCLWKCLWLKISLKYFNEFYFAHREGSSVLKSLYVQYKQQIWKLVKGGGSEVLWAWYKLDEKYIQLKNLVCWHILSHSWFLITPKVAVWLLNFTKMADRNEMAAILTSVKIHILSKKITVPLPHSRPFPRFSSFLELKHKICPKLVSFDEKYPIIH